MNRKILGKILSVLFVVSVFAAMFAFAACSEQSQNDDVENVRYVVSIEKTSTQSDANIYTVSYSDGSSSQLTVADGEDLNITDIWQIYVDETGSDISLSQFIENYLTINVDNEVASVRDNLLSAVSIYSEFIQTTTISTGYPGLFPGMGSSVSSSQLVRSGGSGVIYSIDDDYVYIITNYHVVYDSSADEQKNGGSKIARNIYCYLYGSEGTPVLTGYDENNYYVYDYGSTAIECEYVGGSLEHDIAVLRADRASVMAINDGVKTVTFADDYSVGEEVYAIGNSEGEGLSLTQGVISVDNEYISLDIDEDGEAESYRSIRFDAAIYHGNSGGGLFNERGQLVGITNAGLDQYENMCYAIPVSIVRGAVENIMYYYNDGDDATQNLIDISLGLNVVAQNAKYVADGYGYGNIVEEVVVQSAEQGSVAEELGISGGDIVVALVVNGKEYVLERTFDICDIQLTLRPGDSIQVIYERNGTEYVTSALTLSEEI